jgi:23S rRNA pseudouridine1911/1915/1917 synthase
MLRRQEGNESLRLVHRLDRETSGVLLVAETHEAARHLSRAFESGKVHKEYMALVLGRVERDEGRVDLPLGRALGSRIFVRRETRDGGESAATGWRVLRRLDDRTLLRVFPETGRRHQIRVHLAAIGHPVLGDILYGRPDQAYLDLVRGAGDPRREGPGPRRHLLHCARLVFSEPARHATTEVISPLPGDFRAALET